LKVSPITRRADRERATSDPRSLREMVTEQLAPVAALYARIARRLASPVNVEGARERIRHGRVAFDPRVVIACAGDLVAPYREALTALEDAGLVTNEGATGARARSAAAYSLVSSWASGELRSYDDIAATARFAASLVGRAVLRHASEEVRRGEAVVHGWPHAHCPCCGGAPDMALVDEHGERTLSCVRCDTLWRTSLRGCLGCGEAEAPTVVRITAGELGYTVLVCNPCARYIKEGPAVSADELLVERTLLTSVDLAAKRRGLRF
jgi:hypothetical protein